MKDLMTKIVLLSAVLVLGYGIIETVAEARTSDEWPTVIKAVAPLYPADALSAKASGKVIIDVEINGAGEVTLAKARGGYPAFRLAAENAALHWRFTKATDSTQKRSAQLDFIFNIVGDAKEAGVYFSLPYQIEIITTPPEEIIRTP